MKSILVIDDDQYFRTVVTTILKKHGYEIFEAPNGKIAKNIIQTLSPDLILCDVQMPYCNGFELLEWAPKSIRAKFIFMTGLYKLTETQQAFNKGAKSFISKPFTEVQLIEEIDKQIQNTKRDSEKVPKPTPENDTYCKVSINEFVSQSVLSFDIYVKLKPNKFLKIGHKGAEIPIERKETYKEKGLKYLFIRKEDFRALVKFNLDLSKVVKKSVQISKEKNLSL